MPTRLAILAFALSLLAVALPAHAQNRLLGGPTGLVKSSKGELLEGMMGKLAQ